MRPFEIILLLIITILPFTKRKILTHIKSDYILIFLVIVLVLHLTIEGYRWQMVPAYVLTALLAWRIKAVDISQPSRLSFTRILGYAGISLLIIIGWVLPSVLPVFTLPEPTGQYNVGTELVYVSTDKEEVITDDPGDKRELM